jgi:hypothetical protein
LKRRDWREILDDGTPVPRLRQNRLGRWKQVEVDGERR